MKFDLALERVLNGAALGTCFVVAACGGSGDAAPAPPPATPNAVAGDCASLVNYRASVPTAIETAQRIDASASAPWSTPTNALTPAPLQVTSSMCRVTGVIKPTAQSNIRFEIWLPPTTSAWNGKFLGNAAGGSTGAILYATMTDPLQRGYAVMGHDNGHVSTGPFEQSWAFDTATHTVKMDPIIDFGYRAQHVVTVVSKELTNAFYASAPTHSYYTGCSQGGHHGLMEVQRYPEDYDGVVAGAHGGDWLGMMSSEAYAAVAVLKDNRAGGMTPAQLTAFHGAVVAACDANDGVVDGQIGDPRQCHFDPAVLQCGAPGADPATCLSNAQVAAARAIYTGPRRTGNGATVSPGYAVGSEGNWATTWNSTTSLQSGSYYDFFRFVLKQNPTFDILTLNWDQDIDAGRAKFGPIYDANSTDLSTFKTRRGKLLMYHGWSDPLITPYLSVDYWNRLQGTMGEASVKDFARLFMVPDMGHCAGGGNGTVDWLTALEKWVEQGIAPDATDAASTITGSGAMAGVPRRRPLCPYPMVAKYKGSGDINVAENFQCAAP